MIKKVRTLLLPGQYDVVLCPELALLAVHACTEPPGDVAGAC